MYQWLWAAQSGLPACLTAQRLWVWTQGRAFLCGVLLASEIIYLLGITFFTVTTVNINVSVKFTIFLYIYKVFDLERLSPQGRKDSCWLIPGEKEVKRRILMMLKRQILRDGLINLGSIGYPKACMCGAWEKERILAANKEHAQKQSCWESFVKKCEFTGIHGDALIRS